MSGFMDGDTGALPQSAGGPTMDSSYGAVAPVVGGRANEGTPLYYHDPYSLLGDLRIWDSDLHTSLNRDLSIPSGVQETGHHVSFPVHLSESSNYLRNSTSGPGTAQHPASINYTTMLPNGWGIKPLVINSPNYTARPPDITAALRSL